MPQTFAEDRQRVVGVAHQCQNADELGAALFGGYVLEGVQQFGVVRRITLTVGVTRGVNARRTAQVIHGQS